MSQTFVLRVLEVRPQGTIGDPIVIVGFGEIGEILTFHSTRQQRLKESDAREVYSEEIVTADFDETLKFFENERQMLYCMSVSALHAYQAAERHRLQKEIPVDVK